MFKAIGNFFRSLRGLWRDFRELMSPFNFTDVKWIDEVGRRQINAIDPSETISDAEATYCGRCDRCSRPVWYVVLYTSAGIPIRTLLCHLCAWDLVESSPHILECYLTAARTRYLKKQWKGL